VSAWTLHESQHTLSCRVFVHVRGMGIPAWHKCHMVSRTSLQIALYVHLISFEGKSAGSPFEDGLVSSDMNKTASVD